MFCCPEFLALQRREKRTHNEDQRHVSEEIITEGQILTGVMFIELMRVVTTRQNGIGTVIAELVSRTLDNSERSPSPPIQRALRHRADLSERLSGRP